MTLMTGAARDLAAGSAHCFSSQPAPFRFWPVVSVVRRSVFRVTENYSFKNDRLPQKKTNPNGASFRSNRLLDAASEARKKARRWLVEIGWRRPFPTKNRLLLVWRSCVHTRTYTHSHAVMAAHDHVAPQRLQDRDRDRESDAYALLSLNTTPTSPGSYVSPTIAVQSFFSPFFVHSAAAPVTRHAVTTEL